MTLKTAKNVFFTGIKGVGMTALALAVRDMGKKVSGSDTAETFPTDKILKKNKIKLKVGFSAKNIGKN